MFVVHVVVVLFCIVYTSIWFIIVAVLCIFVHIYRQDLMNVEQRVQCLVYVKSLASNYYVKIDAIDR